MPYVQSGGGENKNDEFISHKKCVVCLSSSSSLSLSCSYSLISWGVVVVVVCASSNN